MNILEHLNPVKWIKDIIKELTKISLPYCIGITIVLFIILYFNKFNTFLGINELIQTNKTIIGFVFLIFLTLSSIKVFELIYLNLKYSKTINKQLDTLCDEERNLLLSAIEKNENTLWIDMTSNSIATSLCNKGLLQMSSGTVTIDSYYGWPHIIPENVYEELCKRCKKD